MNLVSRIARRLAGSRSGAGPSKATTSADATLIDFSDRDVLADPYPHYERLRARGTVHYLPRIEAWIVLGYEDVKAALAQPEIFSNAPYSEVDDVLLAADPPRHESIRRLVARRFTNDMVARLLSFAREHAPGRIHAEMDAVRYATSLTREVAGQMLGFDRATLDELAQAEAESRSAPNPVSAFIPSLDAVAPRSNLHEELISASDGKLDDSQARSLIRLLWLAATTTSERGITRSALRLAEMPELQELIWRDRNLLPAFLDEILRLHPPEPMVPRLIRTDVSLAGVDIPAGAIAQLCVAAANRDPEVFREPSEVRLDRTGRRHLSFGSGIHHCIGAPLSRRLIASAVEALLDAGRLRLAAPPDSLLYHSSWTDHADLSLPLIVESRS